GLGSGSRQAGTAEGLRADHGTDHAAINVNVAMRKACGDMLDHVVDARMDAQGQRRTVRREVIEQRVDLLGAPAHDVKDRPEYFLLQLAGAVELDQGRDDI